MGVIIAILVLWNLVLTLFVFKHIEVYNRTVRTICQAVPGIQEIRR